MLASLVGLLALALGAVALVLTPARLTPLVNEYSSRYLDARVRFDTVTLSVFSNFPNVGIRLRGGEIVSNAFAGLPDSLRAQIPVRADTLLRFDELTVALNLPQLLASRIAVRRLMFRHPDVYAFVAPWGKANWDIFASDSTAADSTATSGDLDFNVGRLSVGDSGRIVYDSRPDKLVAGIDLDHLRLSGTPGHAYKIDFESRNSLRIDTLRYCDSLPLTLRGGFAFDTEQRGGITFDRLTLGIGNIPLVFDGRLDLSQDSIRSDLSCRINPLPLRRLIGLVPPQIMPRLGGFDTDIEVDLDMKVAGIYRYAGGSLPSVRLDIRTDKGHLYHKDARARIENLTLDASLFYRPQRPDSTGAVLRRFAVAGSGIRLAGRGTAWNVLSDPAVHVNLTGAVDLDTLSMLFPSSRGVQVRGRLGVDADAAFRLSQLELSRIGKVRVDGRMTMDGLLIDMPRDTVFMMANGGLITFGAGRNRQDSLLGRDTEMLSVAVQADTLNVNLKNNLRLVASKVSAGARSAASTLGGDTTVVHPLGGEVGARYFEMAGQDSTWLRLYGMKSDFSIVPSLKNPAVPLLHLCFDARYMAMKSDANRYGLADSHVDLSATLNSNRLDSTRRSRMIDSLQTVYPSVPRDSLFAHSRLLRRGRDVRRDDFADADIDISLDKSVGNLLRRWDARGTVRASSGRIVTPYFPLVNVLRNVDIAYSMDEVTLKNTQIRSGLSSLELDGRISNLRRALLGRGALKVEMRVESDTLDFNELAHAAAAGARYGESPEEYRQTLSEAGSDEHLQQMIEQGNGAEDTVSSPLIVVPSNIDARIELCAHYGLYSNLILNTLHGEVIARDRCLQLRDLKAVTNVGEMNLTALYATRSRNDIITGFDLELKRVQVDRLIDLIPSVDTLLPMLRSFEGVVDCQMAATAAVDTMMNLELPTLSAACSIRGENLVLLDGETFAEIAKMLRFKNRGRNLIDRISVDFLIRDNKIEMFPFVIEMDRYKAAVSGVHKLDMSFDYHISVLHSPIPFRLGVNIFGTMDKFKFRIGKARYKNENIPSFVDMIDTTRVNLRRTITDIFRKGVEAASLSELKIVADVDSSALQSDDEKLSRSDSLLLRQEGILPDSIVADSSALIPAAEPDSIPTAGIRPDLSQPEDKTLSRSERRALHRRQKQAEKKPQATTN